MAKFKLVYPRRYKQRAEVLARFLRSANPTDYLDGLTKLSGLPSVVVCHKPLRYAAEFGSPRNIYADFRQPAEYVALSVAHEYSHLLLRHHRWGKQSGMAAIITRYGQSSTKYNYTPEGTIEQVLAVLLQLSYEDRFGLRRFSSRNARELMEIMGVWPMGKPFVEQWSSFIKGRGGLLPWLKKNFSGS